MVASVAGEYLRNLIPRGTHEYERLIRPAELARWARAAGLTVRELAGIDFNPLVGHIALSQDVSVNYLAHLER
jgi:2-polyprenyl-6-hydroxyphenyl methylase / 3-demethylubiquinone-9 3-methyltransferase